MDQNKQKRIKELIKILNEANKQYYQKNNEIMDNYQYDKLYDELLSLEKETSIVLSNSPTQKVGYELLSELQKETHDTPMLSLDKTKEVGSLKSFLDNHKGILSWKLDGLTIVLTYFNGQLVKAVTRGNGEVGEVITNNAKVFSNIPLNINHKGNLVIRGEAVIKYSDFEEINKDIPDENKYKNPRNLCSGTVRQLNNEITAKRNVHFYAFQIINETMVDFKDSKENQLKWLISQGFDPVEYEVVDESNIEDSVERFAKAINTNDFASDGLVLTFDSISFSTSLGSTSKFPRDSIAFKWADEMKETKLLDIEWNASRTGLINPVAIFESVELEGTTVSRASVHNVSIVENLELGIGDTIKVYKANMIIPQVAENLTKSDNIDIPDICPVCGGETEIKRIKDVKALYCTNPDCQAKKIKGFAHFVSRNAMNIEGLSEATLVKFIDKEFLKEFSDIYEIEKFEEEIKGLEGFGEKSYDRLIKSIKKSKKRPLANFIYALGIENIGLSNAKILCKYFEYDLDKIIEAEVSELGLIQGFGEVMALSVHNYFVDEKNRKQLDNLLKYIELDIPNISNNVQVLEGKTFVITGSLNSFSNRNELKEKIESLGGKVTGSVSKNTDYLINNDKESGSSKNKKAKSLDIPIISEEDFIKIIKE